MPTVPFQNGEILPAIPQSEYDRQFGVVDIESGLKTGIYDEVSKEYSWQFVSRGLLM